MTSPNLPERFEARLRDILGAESDDFFARCTAPLARTFRVRPSTQLPADWPVTPVEGLSHVYRFDGHFPLGKTQAHYGGEMYIQSLSSMIPPLVLGAQPGEMVLDMCAAPGSKTTQLSADVGPTGMVVANELSASRSKKLVANLERLGATNVVVTQFDATKMPKRIDQVFDKILLDAPCSSEGYARRSTRYLEKDWSERYIHEAAALQRPLIVAALRMLRPGGEMVYSTCTSAPEENEAVVAHLLEQFSGQVELLPLNLPAVIPVRPGTSTFEGEHYPTEILQNVGRFWPHHATESWDSECFFVCRLKKTGSLEQLPPRRVKPKKAPSPLKKSAHEHTSRALCTQFGLPEDTFEHGTFLKREGSLWYTSRPAAEWSMENAHRRVGVKITDNHGVPTYGFILAYGRAATHHVYQATQSQANDYLAGKDLRLQAPSEYSDGSLVIVRYQHTPLGLVKVLKKGTVLKNKLPRERIMTGIVWE